MQPALHTAGGTCYNTSAQWVLRGMPVTWEIPSLVGGAYWMAFSRRFGTSVDWTLHLVKPTSNTTARTLGEDALPETSKSCGACRWEMPLIISNGAASLAAIFCPTFQELHHKTVDNRWILVYSMKHFASQSQKKTVQTELLGVDIRMVTGAGENAPWMRKFSSLFQSCRNSGCLCISTTTGQPCWRPWVYGHGWEDSCTFKEWQYIYGCFQK